ncbi:FkbM family methyltransferase [bacterium]|jgi:FkbM family methyltransferase|nr:FkbM family methyltransferase [bacterium]
MSINKKSLFKIFLHKIILKLFHNLRKKRFQKTLESLYEYVRYGLNVGHISSDPNKNGEKQLIISLEKEFLKMGNKFPIIFDVGANKGDYTALILEHIKNPQVFLFEPQKELFNSLRFRYKSHKNVHIYNMGLSNQEKKTTLYKNESLSSLASVYPRDLSQIDLNMELNIKENINLSTLDVFCKMKNINHIDFLKIDVEGHEYKVLEGGSSLFSSNSIDHIQFEGGCNVDSRTFFKDFFIFFKERNWNIFKIVINGTTPIEKYIASLEYCTYANYYCKNNTPK